MSEDEPESFIDKMGREKSLPLRVTGGRVLIANATSDALDSSTIELKCWWAQRRFAIYDTSILIGDEQRKPFKWDGDGVQIPDEEAEDITGWSLSECPIMLAIYRVSDDWLSERADDRVNGQFRYYGPIKTDDGVVNEERPTIQAWIALGSANFRLIEGRLIDNETPDFEIGLTDEFPRGTVDSGMFDTKIHWDGTDSLPITRATIVWKCGDWNSDDPVSRQLDGWSEPEEYEPSREHNELIASNTRIESMLAKLTLPVWLAAAAAALAAIASRY